MLMHVARDLPCGVILISGLLGLSMLDRHPATTQPHLPDSGVQRGSAVISDGVVTGPPFWLPVAPMSTPRSDLAATLGPDGRIYALGGFNAVGKYLKTAEAYDEQAGTWAPIASMAVSRSTFDAVTGPDGRIYAISGYTGVTYTRAVEAYTPRLNRWIAVADTVLPHPGSGAVAGPDGRIYVMGANDGQGMGAVEVYSPGDDRWTRLGDLIGGRGDFGVARGPDGRLYAIGGSPGSIYDLAVAEAYNVHTAHWTSLANMPTARRALAAATGADGRIYAIGGGTAEGGPLATVEAYDVRTGRWSRVASLHTPRGGLKAVRGTDGRLYALGGAGGGPPSAVRGTPINPSDYLRVVEAYGPLLHTTPHRAAAGSSVVLTGTNFAASATVTVTWGGTPQGVALAIGHTNGAGALLHPLRFSIPAGTRPGQYVVTAKDDRSLYPVTVPLTVSVPLSGTRTPTPAAPVPSAPPGGRFFPQTGHSLSGTFLAFYQQYGTPLATPAPSCSPRPATWSSTPTAFSWNR